MRNKRFGVVEQRSMFTGFYLLVKDTGNEMLYARGSFRHSFCFFGSSKISLFQ